MSNNSSKPKRIAIQGGYGAFHEIAANKYFEETPIEIVPRNTFKDLLYTVQNPELEKLDEIEAKEINEVEREDNSKD